MEIAVDICRLYMAMRLYKEIIGTVQQFGGKIAVCGCVSRNVCSLFTRCELPLLGGGANYHSGGSCELYKKLASHPSQNKIHV